MKQLYSYFTVFSLFLLICPSVNLAMELPNTGAVANNTNVPVTQRTGSVETPLNQNNQEHNLEEMLLDNMRNTLEKLHGANTSIIRDVSEIIKDLAEGRGFGEIAGEFAVDYNPYIRYLTALGNVSRENRLIDKTWETIDDYDLLHLDPESASSLLLGIGILTITEQIAIYAEKIKNDLAERIDTRVSQIKHGLNFLSAVHNYLLQQDSNYFKKLRNSNVIQEFFQEKISNSEFINTHFAERTTDSTSTTSSTSTVSPSDVNNTVRPEVITTELSPLPGIDTSYYNSSLQTEEQTIDLTSTASSKSIINPSDVNSAVRLEVITTELPPLPGIDTSYYNSSLQPEELDRQLITAVKAGDITGIEQALQSGANIQTIDTTYCNFTPLHWATERGNIEVMNRLLSHGASINVKNAIGHTPRDNGSILHPHMKTHFEKLDRQLHDALVQAQKVGVVTKLLDAGASLTTPNANGYFPLNLAVMACDAEMVSYLLDKGAPVNQRTKNSSNITALEQVPHYGNKPGVANALLKAGAVSPKNTTTNPTPTNNAAPVVTKKTTRKLNLTKLAAANQAKAEAKAQAKAAKKEDKSLRRHVKHLKNIGYVDENMSTSQAVSLHKAGKLTYSGSVYVRDLKDAGYIDKNMPTSQAMNLLKEGKIGSGDAKTNNSDTNTSDGSGSGSKSYNLDNLDCIIARGRIGISFGNGNGPVSYGTEWKCRTDSSLGYTYDNPSTGKSWF